jgi:uncharacterized protein YbaR (Trm112 family)
MDELSFKQLFYLLCCPPCKADFLENFKNEKLNIGIMKTE